MGKARRRNLTDADRRAAARVNELWKEYKSKHPGITQEIAADKAGFTQSAFSQFLKGRVPIRISPAQKFARLFGVAPTEIRPDLVHAAYTLGEATALTAREGPPLSEEAIEIARVFEGAQPQTRDMIRDVVYMFAFVDKRYPWMRRGRPKGESYTNYEKRMVQNISAQVLLEARKS